MSTVVDIDAAREPDEWPSLIAFDDTPDLPPLDLELLPGWLGRFASALSASTETPPELPGAMTMGIASAAAARRLIVEAREGHREPCCLWFVTALEPANLKSACEGAAKRPLLDWEAEKEFEMRPAIERATSERKTAEARLKSLRTAAANVKTKPSDATRFVEEIADIERQMPEVPVPPRLWTSEPTPERLGTLLAENGEAMAVLSSEGGIFDVLAGRYSKGVPNLDLVLKAHAGDSDVTDRLSRAAVRLDFPRLTMALSPQPDVLNALADQPGFAGRGLLARFLWMVPRSRIGSRTFDGPVMPTAVRDEYTSGIRAMLEWPDLGNGACHVLGLDSDARTEWRAFRAEIERRMADGGELEHHRAWAGKASGAALRLAGVFHGVRHAHGAPWDHDIDGDTMGRALAVLATIIPHSTTALTAMGTNPEQTNARRVLDHLKSRRIGACSVRDVHIALKHRLPRVVNVTAALALLEERGYVRVIELPPGEKGGRAPSPTVRVRPELWT